MIRAGTDDWKTPLGYYERAITDLREAREEIQTALQNLKATQASQVEVQTIKTELQTLKAELQTTKECLATTQQPTFELHNRVAIAEKAANAAHIKLQEMKHFMTNRLAENSDQVIKELSQLKEQLFQAQSQVQQIQSQIEGDGSKTQTIQLLSALHSQVSNLADELTLTSSASGINYIQLRNLLTVEEWEKADRETHILMCKISNRDGEDCNWLDRAKIELFPWQDFRIINRLWVESSKGHFGFSVQKQIWQSIKVTCNNDFEVEKSLGDQVGWRTNNNWIDYDKLTFSLSAAEGHLPSTIHLLGIGKGKVPVADRVRLIFSRSKL